MFQWCYLSVTNVLIKTLITNNEKFGYENQLKYTNKSEIIDLSISERSKCPSLSLYLDDTKGTTGGCLGTNLIICGGSHVHSDECHIITYKSIKALTKMLSKRMEAASLIIREKYWSARMYSTSFLRSNVYIW